MTDEELKAIVDAPRGDVAARALAEEVLRLRANNRTLVAMASELLPYGAITGHVCHCSVCLELRGAREAGRAR